MSAEAAELYRRPGPRGDLSAALWENGCAQCVCKWRMSTDHDPGEAEEEGGAPSPHGVLPTPVRIRRVRREMAGVATLELTPASAFGFVPGQFNMLYMFGLGEVAISLSGDPAEDHQIVHTVRALGAISQAITRLRRNDVIGVRGPYGSYWPVVDSEGNDVVIVAGGLGLAPLRPVIYRVLAHRERYGRVVVLYGARDPVDILYRRELEAWRRRLDVDITVTVDHAAADWRGNVGVVPALIGRAPIDPDRTVAMVCGPEIMMRFTIDALRQRGLGIDRIFLSMERNMKCAIGFCGHCQFGPAFVCRDGPVFRFDRVAPFFSLREI